VTAVEKAPTDHAKCIPILASLNMDETRDFYKRLLGFEENYYEEHHYLIVKRDDMELHFWKTDNKNLPENTSCYIRGGQIGSLFEEFKKKSVPGLSEFLVRPWHMREFYITDPHGNLLKFGCVPEEK
jgi:catechol 2,3-dioxygenase-like lactoylglutathione lyase family enzyme